MHPLVGRHLRSCQESFHGAKRYCNRIFSSGSVHFHRHTALSTPHRLAPMLTHDDLLPLLRATRLGRAFRSLASTTSTNTEAARWAAAGAPEGSVVLADYQTAGRGRLGRVWEAAAGQNLLFSLVLHPPLARDRLGLITLTAALAIADVLAEMVQPLRVGIKWPNDILVEERKCCGMLLESAMTVPSTNRPVVILGIGL